jgi:hypothetical protein
VCGNFPNKNRAGAVGFDAEIGKMVSRPEKVEMEFGAKLSGECDLWIVSGNADAEFDVTLSWGKEK